MTGSLYTEYYPGPGGSEVVGHYEVTLTDFEILDEDGNVIGDPVEVVVAFSNEGCMLAVDVALVLCIDPDNEERAIEAAREYLP